MSTTRTAKPKLPKPKICYGGSGSLSNDIDRYGFTVLHFTPQGPLRMPYVVLACHTKAEARRIVKLHTQDPRERKKLIAEIARMTWPKWERREGREAVEYILATALGLGAKGEK